MILRRDVIAGLAALVAAPGFASNVSRPLPLGAPVPFDPNQVTELARTMAGAAYVPAPPVDQAWLDIDYEDYVSIWFNERYAVWRDEPDTPLKLDFFAPGLYFPVPVQIAVVENGAAQAVPFSFDAFDKTDKFPDLPISESMGYSGVRLRAETHKPGIFQEFAVFQGASYFRAIGKDEIYGLSARGLAIDTAEPSGEEFPDFRAFWVEKPAPGQNEFTVHALLDSPRCTGAYKFRITTGAALVMEVEAEIFARETLEHIGIAPLTSMFQFDQTNRDRFSDFRPAVHDSDGLLMINGAGETIWRPLANPRNLQISAFQDTDPKGFGLMQRARKFSDFADIEALYHRRPGAWIEPGEGWGDGAVTLVEIPTEQEIYDNIVCYWRPDGALEPGQSRKMSYRLTWHGEGTYGQGLEVMNTSIGESPFDDGIIVVIDYAPSPDVPEDLTTLRKQVRGSNGEVSEGVVQRNPETGGPRLAFKFFPGEAQLIEFRAQLWLDENPLTEVWLYRWTA
ncbi:MAG: glucan biosynthesis protein G [Pseudomonadota bacterium]